MKFIIDGREYEDYQLSNEQIVRLIEGDNEITDMGHEFLMKRYMSVSSMPFVLRAVRTMTMYLHVSLATLSMAN